MPALNGSSSTSRGVHDDDHSHETDRRVGQPGTQHRSGAGSHPESEQAEDGTPRPVGTGAGRVERSTGIGLRPDGTDHGTDAHGTGSAEHRRRRGGHRQGRS